ncbi:MAG TPA: fumarylacetoacetate hydrolase family protein [Polyangia bacterium]|jgi:2-keto-4-pentenoate hydratase/2-oxohepta-3-ene-1,7-dioic acid hydratase in catechol pathway
MKLFRFGLPGKEKPGVIADDGALVDVSAFGQDYDEAFFGGDGLSRLRAWMEKNGSSAPRVGNDVRWGPAACRPSKIICVGLNYHEHAREQGVDPPKEPVLFLKATTAYCGPNDDLLLPRGSKKTDWEVELGVVIGKKAAYVSKADALSHVAGYVLINDYSEREYQMERGGQWDKGKGCDTFAPVGPFIATADTVDTASLKMWLKVNGVSKQNGSTADMIFDVRTLVSYTSEFMTLLPGDLISTGTPPGVGAFAKPPQFLNAGDIVELGIEGLGHSRQRVVAPNIGR